MMEITATAVIGFLIFAVILWGVFEIIKWGVSNFGLPAIITKVAGIFLGLLFLMRILAVLGV